MNKFLSTIAKVFLGLNALLLVVTWGRWQFTPDAMLAQSEIATETATGINMLKSGMGGSVLLVGIFIFLYLIKGNSWLLPAIIATLAISGTRILSLISDGTAGMTLMIASFELLAVLTMWFLMKRDGKALAN